jgi:dsRNA-specific ribonuclease
MLAELFEAVIGAVYLDGGLPPVRTIMAEHWGEQLGIKASMEGQGSSESESGERQSRKVRKMVVVNDKYNSCRAVQYKRKRICTNTNLK